MDGTYQPQQEGNTVMQLKKTMALLNEDITYKERRLRELNKKCKTLTDIFSDYDTIVVDNIVTSPADQSQVVELQLRAMKKLIDQRDSEIHRLTYDIKRLQQEGDKLRSELNNYNSWYTSHAEADRTAFAHLEFQLQNLKQVLEEKKEFINSKERYTRNLKKIICHLNKGVTKKDREINQLHFMNDNWIEQIVKLKKQIEIKERHHEGELDYHPSIDNERRKLKEEYDLKLRYLEDELDKTNKALKYMERSNRNILKVNHHLNKVLNLKLQALSILEDERIRLKLPISAPSKANKLGLSLDQSAMMQSTAFSSYMTKSLLHTDSRDQNDFLYVAFGGFVLKDPKDVKNGRKDFVYSKSTANRPSYFGEFSLKISKSFRWKKLMEYPVFSMATTNDKKKIIFGGLDGSVKVASLEIHNFGHILIDYDKAHKDCINSVCLDFNDFFMFTCSDHCVKKLRIVERREDKAWYNQGVKNLKMVLIPSNIYLFISDTERSLNQVSAETLDLVAHYESLTNKNIQSMTSSYDSRELYCGDENGNITVLDIDLKSLDMGIQKLHSDCITAMTVIKGDRYLFTGDSKGNLIQCSMRP